MSPATKSSLRSVLGLTWHLIGLYVTVNGFVMCTDPTIETNKLIYQDMKVGGYWAFLTIISLAITIITLGTAVVNDFLLLAGFDDSWLSELSSLLVSSILPVESMVTILYWSILSMGTELMIPEKLGQEFRLPLFLDLSIHVAPAIFLWLDFLLFFPKPLQQEHRIVPILFALCYVTWMEYCVQFNGAYPYPFLNMMTVSARCALYVGAGLCGFLILVAANSIYTSIYNIPKTANVDRKAKAQ